MTQKRHLEELIYLKLFRFDRLDIQGIDNEPAVKIFSESVLEQEICLFANTVSSGDDYCRILHEKITHSLSDHRPLPVVRFADGEYAFYRYTLGCNGLYKQAESIEAIKKAMPLHLAAMEYLSGHGLFAPLVFPGNAQEPVRNLFSFKKQKPDSTGAAFLDFMQENHIPLTADNYIPFYAVYAYLSSADFATAVNGRNICILNSEYNEESCRNWFINQNSSPNLMFVSIPREYVATRWEEVKTPILNKIPDGTDLCIVGAGVGALLICRDVAERFSVPAIDAGHILNMMNNRVDKSNGARLFTLRKAHE
ncbi:MAG TPA: hypothetical protein PKN70_15840 [Smithellaceae bacterium]|nr:hypothetical protein [Smithellaceae bacterium]HPH55010.1 hypothetical protein [Smithella sp.]HPN87273.1 hypothetical protein [Smithella sp.]HQM46903.1 hypothetical protein [Smithellaceae bacterium]